MDGRKNRILERVSLVMAALHATQGRWERHQLKSGEREDVFGRFRAAEALATLPYGTSINLEDSVVRRLWPPTGEHDRSFEGYFRSLSLAVGGNRPETSYTTEERIKRDLPRDFEIERSPMDGRWRFRRPLSACPRCQGEGRYRQMRRLDMGDFDPPEDGIVSVSTVQTHDLERRA